MDKSGLTYFPSTEAVLITLNGLLLIIMLLEIIKKILPTLKILSGLRKSKIFLNYFIFFLKYISKIKINSFK
jgi:hypothetical protein